MAKDMARIATANTVSRTHLVETARSAREEEMALPEETFLNAIQLDVEAFDDNDGVVSGLGEGLRLQYAQAFEHLHTAAPELAEPPDSAEHDEEADVTMMDVSEENYEQGGVVLSPPELISKGHNHSLGLGLIQVSKLLSRARRPAVSRTLGVKADTCFPLPFPFLVCKDYGSDESDESDDDCFSQPLP